MRRQRQMWFMVMAAAALLAGTGLLAATVETTMPVVWRPATLGPLVQSAWAAAARGADAVVGPAAAAIARQRFDQTPRTILTGSIVLLFLLAGAALVRGRRKASMPHRRIRSLAARGANVVTIARRTRMPQDAVRDLVRAGGGRT